jgi:hypothetical protein
MLTAPWLTVVVVVDIVANPILMLDQCGVWATSMVGIEGGCVLGHQMTVRRGCNQNAPLVKVAFSPAMVAMSENEKKKGRLTGTWLGAAHCICSHIYLCSLY